MDAMIHVRIDNKTKKAAQKTFEKMGLDMSSGIKLYLTRVIHDQCVPFQLHVPNKETIKAIEELENPTKRAKLKKYASPEDMFVDILGKDWRERQRT